MALYQPSVSLNFHFPTLNSRLRPVSLFSPFSKSQLGIKSQPKYGRPLAAWRARLDPTSQIYDLRPFLPSFFFFFSSSLDPPPFFRLLYEIAPRPLEVARRALQNPDLSGLVIYGSRRYKGDPLEVSSCYVGGGAGPVTPGHVPWKPAAFFDPASSFLASPERALLTLEVF